MNFKEAEQYLLSFTDYEKIPGIAYTAENYDLRRMEILLNSLGNPHKGTFTIHIAGTKGKGSTASMIAGILTAAGYRTALYTSPHLHTIRERIKINGNLITEDDFANLANIIRPVADNINRQSLYGQLTTFELLTVLAFCFFKQNEAEIQVLEVGLGGRLDATNVAYGNICVITSISLDHTSILGNTLDKIALEKAGIIKKNSSVINFPQNPQAENVIVEISGKNHAPLIQLGKDVTWEVVSASENGQKIKIFINKEVFDVSIPLLGDFQQENAAAAVTAADLLIQHGFSISKENITSGLAGISWPGRMQIVRTEPYVVIDGAHNAYSMQCIIRSVNKIFRFEKSVVIFGSSIDKDIAGMAKEIQEFAQNIILTSSTHPRAASIENIRTCFSNKDKPPIITNSIEDAINKAMQIASNKDLILITGSLFVVAEAIEFFKKNNQTGI